MLAFFQSIVDTKSFMPQGLCLQSHSDFLSLLVMTDIVIMLAKILIAVSLLLFFQKNNEGPLGRVVLLLSVLMSVEVLGQLSQWVRDSDAHQAFILVVIVKGFTCLLAVITAVFMVLKGRGIVKGIFWDSYHEMIATANAPVFGVDLDGRITEWNASAERLTGYLKQEVLGKKMVENFVAEDDQSSVQCVHDGTLKGNETISYELPLITQKGTRVEVLLSSSSQRNRQGEIIGCIGFGQNVTELKKKSSDLIQVNERLQDEVLFHEETKEKLLELTANLDQAVEQRTKKLKRSDQVKSEFITHVSHELRTPLHGLLGFSQLLQADQGLTAEHQEKLAIINECGETLLLMINDLLEVGVHDREVIDFVLEPFDLFEWLMGIRKIAEQQCDGKQIEFELQIVSDDLPHYVIGDAKLMRQLLLNLITNAIKYTEEGSVCLRVYRVDNRFNFQVEDTGRGISGQELENIFDPYYRTLSAETSQGMGLGLAICKKIAVILGSDVVVNSVVNEGSVFEFTVELERATITQLSPSDLMTPVRYDGVEKIIMVVDDNVTNRLYMEELLLGKGFNVFLVESGEECLESVNSIKPDLIVMDLKMQGLNGIETTKQLNKHDANWTVVAMTASPLDQDKVDFFAAGGADFLEKPLNMKNFYYCLQKHLDIHWLEDNAYQSELKRNADSGHRILIVDDVVVNTQWLSGVLQNKGYCVDVVETGLLAIERLEAIDYDFMLIDLAICQGDQRDQLKAVLNTKTLTVSVIALENDCQKVPLSQRPTGGEFSHYLDLPIEWKKLNGIIAAV